MAKRKLDVPVDAHTAVISLSYKVPDAVACPFTGNNIVLLYSENYGWRGAGAFYSTRFFPYKQELLHYLSYRDGKAPAFPPRPVVSVKEITIEDKDPDPLADVKERDASAAEFVEERLANRT